VFWFSSSVLKHGFKSRRRRVTCCPLPLSAVSQISLIRTYITSDDRVVSITLWLLHFAELVFPLYEMFSRNYKLVQGGAAIQHC